MDLSLPTVIGITTPGNKTVFRNGRIGKISGTSSELIASSSSEDNKGMNSVSASRISENSNGVSRFSFSICKEIGSKLQLIA
jgi:hypothetical protein